jgi:hypothetical protein
MVENIGGGIYKLHDRDGGMGVALVMAMQACMFHRLWYVVDGVRCEL